MESLIHDIIALLNVSLVSLTSGRLFLLFIGEFLGRDECILQQLDFEFGFQVLIQVHGHLFGTFEV